MKRDYIKTKERENEEAKRDSTHRLEIQKEKRKVTALT
jgi:hypothetical protein